MWEKFIFFAVGALLIFFNATYFYEAAAANNINDRFVFFGVFINLILLFVLTAPCLSKKAEAINNDKIVVFLDLPGKDKPFRFSDFSSFISDQALGAFLATLLIVTGKVALQSHGPILAALYVAIVLIASIVLTTVSLVRFIWFFTRFNLISYWIVALLSVAVMFSFFYFGLSVAN